MVPLLSKSLGDEIRLKREVGEVMAIRLEKYNQIHTLLPPKTKGLQHAERCRKTFPA